MPPNSRTRVRALHYAARVFESLDTPVSLSCALRLKYGEHKQLAEASVDPKDYLDPADFFLDYQAVKLLSKYPHLDTGVDRRQVALSKFRDAEAMCEQTNARWRSRENGHPFSDQLERVISRAMQKISKILGDVPSLEELTFAFGPGAALNVRGETSVFNKVASPLQCTYVMAHELSDFLAEFPGWLPEGTHTVELTPGSELTFVPKDAKTDRSICIEPLLNGLYQKGVGSYIRDRLRSHGIDLRDQGVNQKLASTAHSTGLCTVDFSSASDTIAYRVVMDLLPIDWFEFLDVGRSPRYLFEGTWTSFQKFSSMGNAYTFELETLIFYALACACLEENGIPYRTGLDVSVYGDDVIIPARAYDLFLEVTVACGFTINEAKSFKDGIFYESCGHDYFNGTLVRPFLLKMEVDTLPSTFYAANTLKRIQKRITDRSMVGRFLQKGSHPNHHSRVVRRLDGVHDWVCRCIPRGLRLLGPEGFGDCWLISNLDEAMALSDWRLRRHRCFDAWIVRGVVQTPKRQPISEAPMGYALYNAAFSNALPADFLQRKISEPLRNGEAYTVRDRTKTKFLDILVHDWVELDS